jgi:hypothetical protein
VGRRRVKHICVSRTRGAGSCPWDSSVPTGCRSSEELDDAECSLTSTKASREQVARPTSKVSNGEDRDLLGLDQVADCDGKPGQEEPPDSCGLADARPEEPCHRALGDRVDRDLLDEVGRGSRVKADLHALPATPALCEARLHRFPVLGGDRA